MASNTQKYFGTALIRETIALFVIGNNTLFGLYRYRIDQGRLVLFLRRRDLHRFSRIITYREWDIVFSGLKSTRDDILPQIAVKGTRGLHIVLDREFQTGRSPFQRNMYRHRLGDRIHIEDFEPRAVADLADGVP